MFRIFRTGTNGGSLFQVPSRIVVLLAESRAWNSLITLGLRTVPLAPLAANKWLPCSPTPELCGAGRVSRRQAFGVESRSRPAVLASQIQPNEQFAHILVQRGIRQLQYRALCEGEQRE